LKKPPYVLLHPCKEVGGIMKTSIIYLIYDNCLFLYISGDHSTYIPAHQRCDVSMLTAVQGGDVQENVPTLINYAERSNREMLLSKTTCSHTEKISLMKYPGLELVPMGETRIMSIEMNEKMTPLYSHLGAFHFTEASTEIISTKHPSMTEHTVVTCVENVKPDNEFPDL
jgi:hypothetical protein